MTDGMSDEDWARALDVPKNATAPGQAFYRQHFEDLRVLTSELHHIETMRKMRLGLDEILRPVVADAQARESRLHASLDAVDDEFRRGSPFRAEVMSTRYVDSYLAYVSEMLATLLVRDPRALKSNEQVRIADVLDHAGMDDFIEWLADDRVSRLSFKGFSEISQYVQDRLGLPLLPEGDLNHQIARSIATRNLIVHRRGVIDRRYVDTLRFAGFATETFGLGSRLTSEQLSANAFATIAATLNAVGHFEEAAAAKFDLERAPVQAG